MINQLSDRDIAVLKFINEFGYSFNDVLGEGLFWNTPLTSKGRLAKLEKKYKLIRFKNTGLMTPRRAIFLTESGKKFLSDIGVEHINKRNDVAIQTVNHLMLEQKVFYVLSSIGKVERTTVKKHSKKLEHTPDFLYEDNYFIEVEISQKSQTKYKEIVYNLSRQKDLKSVVYVTETLDFAKTLAKALPLWDRLRFIDYETLFTNVIEHQKIRPFKQVDLIS